MFLEGLGSASITNGVLRIQTVYLNAKGETVIGEDLFVPATRLIPLSEELQNLIVRLRDQEAAQVEAAAVAKDDHIETAAVVKDDDEDS